MDRRLVQTYIRHRDKLFFVSTINRESSAQLMPGDYAETMAWEIDKDDLTRRSTLAHEGDVQDSIDKHFEIVSALYEKGEY